MGFAIHKGVELSCGEVYIMRFVVYNGVGKTRNFEGERIKNFEESLLRGPHSGDRSKWFQLSILCTTLELPNVN